MNKSSVRRALTTLKKSGLMQNVLYLPIEDQVRLTVYIPSELTKPKRKTLKTKKVLKTIQIGEETSLESWVEKQSREVVVHDIPAFEQKSKTVKIKTP